MGELKLVDELVLAVLKAKVEGVPYRLDWSMETGVQTLVTPNGFRKWRKQSFLFGRELPAQRGAEDMTEKALAVAGPLDLEGTKRAMAAFDKFKSEVLTDQDFWVGRDRQGVEMKHIKRSGLMKFLMAINGNAAVTDERSEVIKFENKEILVFHFTARATAPNGRFTEAVGSASSDERKFDKPVHDLTGLSADSCREQGYSESGRRRCRECRRNGVMKRSHVKL